MKSRILKSLIGIAFDFLLAALTVAVAAVVFVAILTNGPEKIPIWLACAIFVSAVATLFLLRHHRRRAYGIVELATSLAIFSYALYFIKGPTEVITFIFQSAAAVYIAIRGLDNIALFHKRG